MRRALAVGQVFDFADRYGSVIPFLACVAIRVNGLQGHCSNDLGDDPDSSRSRMGALFRGIIAPASLKHRGLVGVRVGGVVSSGASSPRPH